MAASPALGMGKAPLNTRQIVGGERVETVDPVAQHTVRLSIVTNSQESTCSGSLISSSVVLTAAHCLVPPPDSVTIEFSGIAAENHESRKGLKSWIHPDYGSGQQAYSDLALVRFAGGIPFGAAPVRILQESLPEPVGTQVTIAGYGKTLPGGEFSDELMKTTQTVVREHRDTLLLRTQAGEIESSACTGDSGGPAFIEKNGELYLWGVAKAVAKPACLNGSYYTQLHLHLQQITLGLFEISLD